MNTRVARNETNDLMPKTGLMVARDSGVMCIASHVMVP